MEIRRGEGRVEEDRPLERMERLPVTRADPVAEVQLRFSELEPALGVVRIVTNCLFKRGEAAAEARPALSALRLENERRL